MKKSSTAAQQHFVLNNKFPHMADTKQEPGQGGAPTQAPPTAQRMLWWGEGGGPCLAMPRGVADWRQSGLLPFLSSHGAAGAIFSRRAA